MTRTVPLLAAAAIAVAAPAAAVAKKPEDGGKGKLKNAKVLRGTLAPVNEDVAAYSAFRGSAKLTANKRNANLVVKVRGLAPKTRYAWSLVEGDCAGAPVAGLRYKALKTGGSGRGTAKASSKKGRFTRDLAAGYSVVVMQAGTTDEVLLCGALAPKKGGKGGKGGKRGKDQGGRPVAEDRPGKGGSGPDDEPGKGPKR